MKLEAKKLLLDMADACRNVEQFTTQSTLNDYLASELLRSAVERKFEIIGEALVRLRQKDPETFLKISSGNQAIAFRNRLVHGYDVIDHETVWRTVQTDL
ncbi:MAG TPA: HepT-like ribonuclease domain-containing protein, partial [Chthoniobacterales bacterium]